ncbi:MAG: hypothetical protein ACREKL_16170 [Chthoniobacterales bacterium]
MTVVELIDEIRHLSPSEQSELRRHLLTLKPWSPEELTAAAQKLADAEDPAETAVIKEQIATGFYGNSHA